MQVPRAETIILGGVKISRYLNVGAPVSFEPLSGCRAETDEHPQLFFPHQFKTGDPIQLAHENRAGFDLLNVKLMD